MANVVQKLMQSHLMDGRLLPGEEMGERPVWSRSVHIECGPVEFQPLCYLPKSNSRRILH